MVIEVKPYNEFLRALGNIMGYKAVTQKQGMIYLYDGVATNLQHMICEQNGIELKYERCLFID